MAKNKPCIEIGNDDQSIIFAENLKYLQGDMSQDEFATYLGVNVSTLRNWLSYKAFPKEKLSEIAKVLGVSPEQLTSSAYRMRMDALNGYVRTIDDVYPINVIRTAIKNCGTEEDPEYNTDYYDFTLRSMYGVISELTPGGQTVVEYYYRDGLTMKEIGNKLGITPDRVSQIMNKALRHIYKKTKSMKSVPELSYNMLEVKLQKAEHRIHEIETLIGTTGSKSCEPDTLSPNACVTLTDLNLDVRAYNCLNRTGIKTLEDIIAYDQNPEKKWHRIRGLGTSTFYRISEAVKKFGYTMKPY